MSSSITKVAIAGFTGKMARRITSHLLQKPNVTIHGLCRNPSKVESSIASLPNVHLFAAASADSAALRTALAGTSVCICTYSGDDELMVDGQEALIDACIHEKVPRYVASDYCLDYRNLKLGDHPVKDAMKHVRSYLEEKEKRGDITGVHIINGAFTEYVWAPFLGWVNYEQERFEYYGTGEEKIQMATYDDVAKFTAEVALDPEASGFLNFLGDSKSVKELASLYQEAYGVTPQVERKGSLDDLYKIMRPVYEQNRGNPFAWMGMFYNYWVTSGVVNMRQVDNGRYPNIHPTSAREFLKGKSKEDLSKAIFF